MVIKRLEIEIVLYEIVIVLHYLLCWHGAPIIYKKSGGVILFVLFPKQSQHWCEQRPNSQCSRLECNYSSNGALSKGRARSAQRLNAEPGAWECKAANDHCPGCLNFLMGHSSVVICNANLPPFSSVSGGKEKKKWSSTICTDEWTPLST